MDPTRNDPHDDAYCRGCGATEAGECWCEGESTREEIPVLGWQEAEYHPMHDVALTEERERQPTAELPVYADPTAVVPVEQIEGRARDEGHRQALVRYLFGFGGGVS